MKKIYVKYNILLNGFNPVGEYEIDGFILKTGKLGSNYSRISDAINTEFGQLNFNSLIESCLVDYDELNYRYFQSNYFEYEVANNTTFDEKNITAVIKKYNLIYDRVINLEKKLRLIFNIPLLFYVTKITFYDENKKALCSTNITKVLSHWNRLNYNLNPKIFSNNSRFHIDFTYMQRTGNNRFDRALEFYNDSFDSDLIPVRYLLIFSSLESIFNLDGGNIVDNLARYSAKLISNGDSNAYDKVYSRMKKLYEIRSKYVHGASRNRITVDDEKELRVYARKIIISYWFMVFSYNMSSREILKYLSTNAPLDINLRVLLVALNSDDFSSQQERMLNMLEHDYNIDISDELRNNLCGICRD